ncbi:sulfate transporter family-domain-containing protein [Leptodontidium sp. 2 PMI_412]|nr:sulfate transporter family-domain-containing protein [Leptodontidium sp. 2 PMI_412]
MGFSAKIRNKIRNDPNLPRLGRGVTLGARGLRAGTGKYFSNKLPIIQWISVYNPRWIMDDALAGLSVGMLLIPQALIYSTIAGAPIQQALLASWLPGVIYAFMGTSRELGKFKIPPALAAAVVSFSVGIWSLIFGVLNLGFIFDFLSVPMSLGFTMGTAIVVINSQIPDILGLKGVSPVFTDMMLDIIKKIGETKGITVAIAIASIVLLAGLQFAGNKWGKKNSFVRILAASRHINVLGMFTGISYFVNKDLDLPQWSVLGPIATTPVAAVPNQQILSGLIVSMITLMLSTSLEHVALAKTFAHKGGYKIDQNQEVFSLGIINLVNSFFGALPVGGSDMARASVNATSGSKSPLSGIFSSGMVFVGMYALSNSLKFIPSATVAAVIVVAVFDQMPPQKLIGAFWKISFVDFIQLLIAFNMTMVQSGTLGVIGSLVFMIVYTLMRIMFSRPTGVVSVDLETQFSNNTPPWWAKDDRIPAGTQVFKLETDAIWLNTDRLKRHIMDTVYTYQAGVTQANRIDKDKTWNYRLEKHIATIRKNAGVNDADTFIPRLRVVIIDMTSTSFIDICAIQIFQDIKSDLRLYAGEGVEFRFVGMNKGVKKRFERAGWKMVAKEPEVAVPDLWFDHLPHAIQHVTTAGPGRYDFERVSVDMQKF